MAHLSIKKLVAGVENKEILHGLDLDIPEGKIVAIMGPNGSGKSTLASVLSGHPKYEHSSGEALLGTKNLFDLKPEERSALGLFLAFQYPKEIPGVNLVSFLRAAYNAVNKARDPEFQAVPLYNFKKIVQEKMDLVGLPRAFMNRNVNEGFSGGEKKKCEILQLALLEPEVAILDETDSGLDIDALKTVCETVHAIKKPKQTIVMITHYERMLSLLKPDEVHVLINGKIVKSGGAELAGVLEEQGYDAFREKSSLKVLA